MWPREFWISGARLALPDGTLPCGALRVAEGRIVEIVEGPVPGPAVCAEGLALLPGLVDLHGDMLEKEMEPRPGAVFPADLALYELDKRLAGNGVTTAYAAVCFFGAEMQRRLRSARSAREIVLTVHRLRETLLVDMRIHARYEITTPDVAASLLELLDEGYLDLVSLMDHTPGQGQYRDVERYVETLARYRQVSREAMEEELRRRMARVRDAEPLWGAAQDVARRTLARGVPLASHDDDTLEKAARVAGLGVTVSDFPVTLEAAQWEHDRGIHVVMGAPNALRGGSHSGNLGAREAIEAGVVDVLAADYHPSSLLQAVFALEREDALPLHRAVQLVTDNPARAMGLDDRGALSVGRRADLTLVEAGARPRVRATFRAGVPIYWDRQMVDRIQEPAAAGPERMVQAYVGG